MPEFDNPPRPDPDGPPDSKAPGPSEQDGTSDGRLYVRNSEGWQAHVKQGWEKQYCYSKFPGEDHFHLILNGEIFLQHGDEKLCLSCALRRGVITTERLFWQGRHRKHELEQI